MVSTMYPPFLIQTVMMGNQIVDEVSLHRLFQLLKWSEKFENRYFTAFDELTDSLIGIEHHQKRDEQILCDSGWTNISPSIILKTIVESGLCIGRIIVPKIHPLTPRTCECVTFIWQKRLCSCQQIKDIEAGW